MNTLPRKHKIGGQVICTVKYADDIMLLAKEEMELLSMTERLIEIRRCYGMEMNVENLKATIPNTDYVRSKTARKCRIFQLFGQHDNI